MDIEAAKAIAQEIVQEHQERGPFRRDLTESITSALLTAYKAGDAHGYARRLRQEGREGFTPGPQIVRHKKRGTEYEVIGRASVQAGNMPLREGDRAEVYRSLDDGSIYARPTIDFEDGRFETIVQRSPEHGVSARDVAVKIVFLSVGEEDGDWVIEKWKGEIDAAEALIRHLLREKTGIPAGWRLVPDRPTREWIDTVGVTPLDNFALDDAIVQADDFIANVLATAPLYPLPVNQHQTAHRFSVHSQDDADSDPGVDLDTGYITEHSIAIWMPNDTERPSIQAHIGAGERYRRIAERICAVMNRAISGN